MLFLGKLSQRSHRVAASFLLHSTLGRVLVRFNHVASFIHKPESRPDVAGCKPL